MRDCLSEFHNIITFGTHMPHHPILPALTLICLLESDTTHSIMNYHLHPTTFLPLVSVYHSA